MNKRIPTPATEASQYRSINKLLGQIKTKINNFTPRGDKMKTKVVIILCVTGLARVALVMAAGWVQLGGKYAGKPCAKQPGQTTKPKWVLVK